MAGISDPNNAQVIFVNQVLGQGHLNGVINLTLGVARFTPDESDNVETDMVIAARLRMDLVCAMQLRDSLDAIIKKVAPEAEKLVQ